MKLSYLGLLTVCLLSTLTSLPWPSVAQVMGDEAEMGRLRVKAEDAIANDDPDGAAMMMGRAALMAAQLAKKQERANVDVYKGLESLFRSEEHTYRAMALFRRAGGQLPASSGVCGSLALAEASLRHALELAVAPHSSARAPTIIEEARQLRESADNWTTVIASMIADYQCP